jgi:hypothetical protein
LFCRSFFMQQDTSMMLGLFLRAHSANDAAHSSPDDVEELTGATLQRHTHKAHEWPDDQDGHHRAERASRRVKVGNRVNATAEEEHCNEEAVNRHSNCEDDHRLREDNDASLDD